ncbi:Anti-sigma-V factor RsiV [compost metagenome]
MAFQPPIIIQTVKAAFPKAELSLPHVSGGVSEAANDRMNRTIRDEVQQLVHSQGSLDDPRAEMLGYYEQKNNQKDYLSLSLFNYAYTGGAHGLTLQRSLTFKQSTGQTYTLEQLFKPGSKYINRINENIRRQIKERSIDTLKPFTTIRPDQDYYIADRSLVIYFQLYELAAYVFGFAYFPISVYELQDIISEDGPLGPMIVND